MPDGTLPQPERRKRATPRQIAEILIRQEGRCNLCPTILADVEARPIQLLGRFDVDHVQPLDHLGTNHPDNLQILCGGCHKVKTAKDRAASDKGRRLRGETGNGRKRPIQSRGFATPEERRRFAQMRTKRPLEEFYIEVDPLDGLPFPKKRRAG